MFVGSLVHWLATDRAAQPLATADTHRAMHSRTRAFPNVHRRSCWRGMRLMAFLRATSLLWRMRAGARQRAGVREWEHKRCGLLISRRTTQSQRSTHGRLACARRLRVQRQRHEICVIGSRLRQKCSRLEGTRAHTARQTQRTPFEQRRAATYGCVRVWT